MCRGRGTVTSRHSSDLWHTVGGCPEEPDRWRLVRATVGIGFGLGVRVRARVRVGVRG